MICDGEGDAQLRVFHGDNDIAFFDDAIDGVHQLCVGGFVSDMQACVLFQQCYDGGTVDTGGVPG